ncbi:MAG: xanthine dehydrogenase family protein molybdopterin-binding subunit [Dehalococcoidia bacterium]|jgi:CO/xanthine dehydrogenase Mo-binding subunit|nr:xanthine dehydrogenase family protein molybdopterin-binding subunit [Dehalococcoidia bacterium]
MTQVDGEKTKDNFRVLGQSIPRVDAVERVQGRAAFAADVHKLGALYGKVLRSPHAHARILKIDVSRARVLSGVKAVITGKDIPALGEKGAVAGELPIDLDDLREIVMAQGKATWQGHPVAAVAATSSHIADEALDLIEVEYEVLPVVDDVRAAMEPDAPIIHEKVRTQGFGDEEDRPTNVSMHMISERGDVEVGFTEADVVIEREFTTTMVHQGYLEPHACTAEVDAGGHVTVWTTTQGAFGIKAQICFLLGLSHSQVTVVPTEIGGGFGGKNSVYPQPLAIILARMTGRPVSFAQSRLETFVGTGPAPGSSIRTKIGVTRDGRITAIESDIAMESGAYPGSSVGIAAMTGYSYYAIPNLRIDAFEVVTNRPHVAAYRAPGAPQGLLPVETIMDEVAAEVGIDPVELRLRNVNPEGGPMSNDQPLPRIGLQALLEEVRGHPAWTSPVPEGRGRGLAVGFWGGAAGVSSAQLTVNPDSTFEVVTGSVDLTGVKTMFAQVVAEEFGVDVSDVHVSTGDTDSIGYTDGSWGSRTTYATGTAVLRAVGDAMGQLKDRAAQALQVDPDEIDYADRTFFVKDNSEQSIPLGSLARANARQMPGPIVGKGTVTGMAAAPSTSVHVVEVAVDHETGKVGVERYTAFQDPGMALNPMAVEGQIQGGASQGLGWALWEGYHYDGGVLRNATLLDYRMPTALDVPMVDVELVGTPAPDGPYGARGVGEACLVPGLALFSNAIAGATGVRLREFPLTSEKILFALQKENLA